MRDHRVMMVNDVVACVAWPVVAGITLVSSS